MSLTIEQAQQLSNMRVRMLNNTQAGKPAHEGFTEEELTAGLAMIRQSRGASAAAQAAKKEKKGKKVKTPIDTSAFFGGLDLDAEDEEEEDHTDVPDGNGVPAVQKNFGVDLD